MMRRLAPIIAAIQVVAALVTMGGLPVIVADQSSQFSDCCCLDCSCEISVGSSGGCEIRAAACSHASGTSFHLKIFDKFGFPLGYIRADLDWESKVAPSTLSLPDNPLGAGIFHPPRV
jgi:hypothetical protein